MKKRNKSTDKISQVALLSIICDNILHESTRLTSCAMRFILMDVIDEIEKGANNSRKVSEKLQKRYQ